MTPPDCYRSEAFAEDLPGWGGEPLALHAAAPAPVLRGVLLRPLGPLLAALAVRAQRKRPERATLQRA